MRYIAAATLALLTNLLPLTPAAGEAMPRTLRVCDNAQDPPTLDPHKQFIEKTHTICQQIFEGLVRFTPDGQIEPALAVSWERIDPLRIRFKLRTGVSFHNGEAFTAQSVQASITRYLDPKTNFPARGFLSSLKNAEIIDTQTIDIVTHYPDGLLLHRLAGFVLIIPPHYLKEVGDDYFASHPVGTGAFRFTEWRRGDRIILSANPNYWMKNLPPFDILEFRQIPPTEQLEELFAGKVDVLMEIPGTQTFKVQDHPNTRVRKEKTFNTLAPGLRFSKGPLADRRVRLALNYATNKKALIRYDLLGNGRAIASLSMPGEEGHNTDLTPYPYDPEKARALLAEAGYAKGLTLKTMVKESIQRTARILAADWERVGIHLDIDIMSEKDFPKRYPAPQYDLGLADVPDPMAHTFFNMALVLYSKSPFSLGEDPVFDKMLEEMSATIDEKKRIQLAKNIDAYVYTQALSIFTYQRLQTYAIRTGVSIPHYVTGMPYFFNATINGRGGYGR